MQEKETLTVVRCKLNSVTRVTVRHHTTSLVMPKSYPRDGTFNPHPTTILKRFLYFLHLEQ